jgi:zinc finger protein
LTIKKYRRTSAQNALFGITDEEALADSESHVDKTDSIKDEILTFGTNCPNCNVPCDTNMKVTQIPHFKEVIIMATSCDACGQKSNEVKSGTGIAEDGIRYRLVMNDASDLNRDILVSETSSFSIPDLDFELSSSKSIGGRFTTLEGIFTTLKTQLTTIIMPFHGGDSYDSKKAKNPMSAFVDDISLILAGEKFVTVVLDDPAGNCYLQNVCAPEPDPQLTVEHYSRSDEQNELLGINDMVLENYEEL